MNFSDLLQELDLNYPDALSTANELAAVAFDPQIATADKCWEVIWNKPLFANAEVEIAEKSVSLINPFMENSWETWADELNGVLVTKSQEGTSNGDFTFDNDLARRIREETNIDPHRLFAIRNAAIALKKRAMLHEFPYDDLIIFDTDEQVTKLKEEMEEGWDDLAILHLLVDFGFAVEPDEHLVNTIKFLGLYEAKSNSEEPSAEEIIQINMIVKDFTEKEFGAVSSSSLRTMANILMEISKCGLVG